MRKFKFLENIMQQQKQKAVSFRFYNLFIPLVQLKSLFFEDLKNGQMDEAPWGLTGGFLRKIFLTLVFSPSCEWISMLVVNITSKGKGEGDMKSKFRYGEIRIPYDIDLFEFKELLHVCYDYVAFRSVCQSNNTLFTF